MSTRFIFINLPVADIERSRAFFEALDFSFNAAFCDDTALCMRVNEGAFYMLLSHPKYTSFTDGSIVTPSSGVAALHAFTVASRDEVDATVATAIDAGGRDTGWSEDHGFMYGRSFRDLDGHVWQAFWMDPSCVPPEVKA